MYIETLNNNTFSEITIVDGTVIGVSDYHRKIYTKIAKKLISKELLNNNSVIVFSYVHKPIRKYKELYNYILRHTKVYIEPNDVNYIDKQELACHYCYMDRDSYACSLYSSNFNSRYAEMYTVTKKYYQIHWVLYVNGCKHLICVDFR